MNEDQYLIALTSRNLAASLRYMLAAVRSLPKTGNKQRGEQGNSGPKSNLA